MYVYEQFTRDDGVYEVTARNDGDDDSDDARVNIYQPKCYIFQHLTALQHSSSFALHTHTQTHRVVQQTTTTTTDDDGVGDVRNARDVHV